MGKKKIKDNDTCWHVIADKNVDQSKVMGLLAKYGAVALRPNEVTRMERSSNGLLVHRDPELCFVTMGPDDLDKRLKDKIINAVLKAQKVYAC